MQIQLHHITQPDTSLEEFADKHGLVMDVYERSMDKWARSTGMSRFAARFHRAEVHEGTTLTSSAGYGDTPESAISDYVFNIRGELLVIDAVTPTQREIRCPNEWTVIHANKA